MEKSITSIHDNHYTLTSAVQVQSLCTPVFNHLNTKYVNFVRRFKTGVELCLTTDPHWTQHFFNERLYHHIETEVGLIDNTKLINQIKVMSWAGFPNSVILNRQRALTNIGIGISIAFIKNNYTDLFHFGTDANKNEMTNFYISNTDLLIKFCDYFRTVGQNLIVEATKSKNLIYVPFSDHTAQPVHVNTSNNHELDIAKFLDSIALKKIKLILDGNEVILSRKETECLKHLFLGETSQEMSKKMFLSFRTIETHLAHIRAKLNVRSKSEIIRKLISNGLHYYLV